jgi:hypothetical protein
MAFVQIFITAQPEEQVGGRWIKTPEGEWIATLTFNDMGGFPIAFVSMDWLQLQNLVKFLQKMLEEFEKLKQQEPMLIAPKPPPKPDAPPA